MQLKFVFLILILLSSRLYGQLQIDAGIDTIVCHRDTTVIGGNPTASGGVEPYTYTWTTSYSVGSNTLNASFFLDDTTKANPSIIVWVPNQQNLKFKLQVKDNTGDILSDSISIRFSIFQYWLTPNDRTINQGDTITLTNNIYGGIEPLFYSWTPSYNISDTSIFQPLVWPDISTNYHVIVSDSIGCAMSDTIKIHVMPLAISQRSLINFKSTIIPNPITGFSVISLDNESSNELSIEIISANGQVILIDRFSTCNYFVGDKINDTGSYIYIIKDASKIISLGRFVKE